MPVALTGYQPGRMSMTQLQAVETTAPLPDFVLSASTVSLPGYDRSRLTPAVVHLGAGSFHRAHQAVYFDRLASTAESRWGVVDVGIHRADTANALAAQDTMFTVVERDQNGSSARVVGSVIDVLVLSQEPDAVVARMADDRAKLVTLTITGDGYHPSEPDGSEPGVFDLIVRALDERRLRGRRPFTVLSCDNLPDSSEQARSAVLQTAARHSEELRAWIEDEVTFPASMVDRITPSTSADERERIEQEFGVCDLKPVITEPFAQWVIEDRFCNDRPPLDSVGASYVSDVAPYKLIKSRLLNGSHCALAYLGMLAGYQRADEAMAERLLAYYVKHLMLEEVAPLLPRGVAEMELDAYQSSVMERLRNPAISDELARLGRRGSTKMPSYLLPSLIEARARGMQTPLLTLAVAAWLRFASGTDLAGAPIEVADDRAAELATVWQAASVDGPPVALIPDIFGPLAADAQFIGAVTESMFQLEKYGVSRVLSEELVGDVG
jgi:mannitol 2-dehydrogenase